MNIRTCFFFRHNHIVMLNLFQHLTASLYLLTLLGEILKRVQDDVVLESGCHWRRLSIRLKFAIKREQSQACYFILSC